MKTTRRSIKFLTVGALLTTATVCGQITPAGAAAKPGCGDMAVIQELSKGLTALNPTGDPKAEAAKLKKSADKLKGMAKTAPKELKSDYDFMAKLMADLSVSFAKIDMSKPETLTKGLEPLTKGAAKLGQVGPHFSAYAVKNCK